MNKSLHFQPKDARAFIASYQDEEEDDELSDVVNTTKRIMTETQALVDFLKTTSPEEFHRVQPTERSLFARIRKPKRTTTTTTTSATPSLSSSRSEPSSATGSTAPTSYAGSDTGSRKKYIELVPQKAIPRSTSFEPPMFPPKQRNLYNAPQSYPTKDLDVKVTKEFLEMREGMDVIESALLQRLGRIRLSNEHTPSDQVATGLAAEHVRALGITHALDNNNCHDAKTKIRHMQVQTAESPDFEVLEEETAQVIPADIRAQRAEAALENAYSHFEAISGLAYKKLQELWEEKTRWENACFELRDRIVSLEGGNHSLLLEEQDGLSEFPIQ